MSVVTGITYAERVAMAAARDRAVLAAIAAATEAGGPVDHHSLAVATGMTLSQMTNALGRLRIRGVLPPSWQRLRYPWSPSDQVDTGRTALLATASALRDIEGADHRLVRALREAPEAGHAGNLAAIARAASMSVAEAETRLARLRIAGLVGEGCRVIGALPQGCGHGWGRRVEMGELPVEAGRGR